MVKILDEVQQKAIYNGWLTGASKNSTGPTVQRKRPNHWARYQPQVSGVPEEKGCKTKV
ncbi:rIIB protein [Klebsiella phage CPRSB]|nr:rIIB protein [Klebsiella phage CPRSB]